MFGDESPFSPKICQYIKFHYDNLLIVVKMVTIQSVENYIKFKSINISFNGLSSCQLAIRSTSTWYMGPDFSHNKIIVI